MTGAAAPAGSPVQLAPCFLPAGFGRLHLARWLPAGGTRGTVLLVPPFAEELNKCRRMLALLGHGLAARGFQAVLPDLRGTGDSDGDFDGARWAGWLEDLRFVRGWLADQGASPTALVGVRLGARLALDLVPDPAWGHHLRHLVLWQPVFSGRQHLVQFLRLRMAGSLLGNEPGETVAALQAKLRAGQSLEVAGYVLSPGLAADLEGLPDPLPALPAGLAVRCYEVSPAEQPQPGRATADQVTRWQAESADAGAEACRGDTFWSTVEVTVAPALLDRTFAVLTGSVDRAVQS